MDVYNKIVRFGSKPQFILVFMILFGASGCNSTEPEADAFGNFEAVEIVVSSETGGRLLVWDVAEGKRMDAGVVAGLSDTTALSLQREQVRAQMEVVRSKQNSVDAQMAVIREQLAVADVEKNRITGMFGSGAATRKQLDDIEGQIRVLNRQSESVNVQKVSISAEIKALNAQIDVIQDQIRRATVINPVEGTVLANYVEFGEMVAPGKPLYRIANLDNMELRAFVDARQLADLSLGQKVQVMTDGSDGSLRRADGEITWISPRAEFTPRTIQTRNDRVTLVYAIKIRVPSDGTIKIGMPGEVRFVRAER